MCFKTFFSNYYYDILFRNDQTQLSKCAIATVTTNFVAPELVAITLLPVVFSFRAGNGRRIRLYLCTGCCFYPCSRNKLFAIPLSFLQVELAELTDIFCFYAKTK